MSESNIRVLVVDDHPVFLKGLIATIDLQPDMKVVGTATTGSKAVELFRELQPDVTVMDITLKQGMNGIETTTEIRRGSPDARVIVFSVHQEEDVIYQAFAAGASNYLFKEALPDELVHTIREVYADRGAITADIGRKLADRARRTPLTKRETAVLRLLGEGLRNKEIANRLGISDQTVQSHIQSVFAKLGVSERTKAVRVALERGLVDPPRSN